MGFGPLLFKRVSEIFFRPGRGGIIEDMPPHEYVGDARRPRFAKIEEEAMSINDLPAIMGAVLIVAGIVMVGIYTRLRTDRSEKSVQAGALLVVVGAVLLGVSLFVPHAG